MASQSTIILITGANSGVGYAIAEVLGSADEKYHVILACRSTGNAQKAAADLKSTAGIKGAFSIVKLDVNDLSTITDAAREVESQFGRVDVLINNAGIAFGENTPEVFEKTMKTNVLGPALVTDAFKHLLLKSKNPYSIYVSSRIGSLSIASDSSQPDYKAGWNMYRQSKSALNMYIIEEIKDLGEQGVKMFAMCPGFVVSNLRGKSEEQRSGWGNATDPLESGRTVLGIVEGKRDADVGKFVHKDGVYTW